MAHRVVGLGQKIGVLDNGFGQLESINLTSNADQVHLPSADINYDLDVIVSGTQTLEIINAIAPEAELYACRYHDLNNFRDCIAWMADSGIKIIVNSSGTPTSDLMGTLLWAQEIENVTSEGILWINAAGNFEGGIVKDTFRDRNGDGFHEFINTGLREDFLTIEATYAPLRRILLISQRSGDNSSNDNDLNIVVTDSDNQSILFTEIASYTTDDFGFQSIAISGNQVLQVQVRGTTELDAANSFELYVEFASIPNSLRWETLLAPGDSESSLTVGGLHDDMVAYYSLRGFLDNGLVKPDLVAPAEMSLINTTAIGTGAASALVGGVAALLWQQNPDWINSEVRQYFVNQDTTPYLFDTGTPLAENTRAYTLNIRGGDSTDFPIVSVLPPATNALILGVSNRDHNWYLIQLANGTVGWIASNIVTIQGNVLNLERISPPPRPIPNSPTPTETPIPSTVPPAQPTSLPVTPNIPTASPPTYEPPTAIGPTGANHVVPIVIDFGQ